MNTMFIKRGKKAQVTAEYAILFALVVAAALGVQSYVQKSLETAVQRKADWFLQQVTGDATNDQWHGIQVDRHTYNQTSHREFVEDYDNPDEPGFPFTYKENTSATWTSTEVK